MSTRRGCMWSCLGLGLLIAAARVVAGGNFTGADAEIVAVAERARGESAKFWSRSELPGEWSAPCPITFNVRAGGAGGSTTFLFDRGEVSGWRMLVSGNREEVLCDVVPHEVDHMVRASLVRRAVPRWLDEGCAIVMESAESHRRFRERVGEYVRLPLTHEFLNGEEYPSDAASLDRLYVVGFSLVEFLLERRGPEAMLRFQEDAVPASRRIVTHFGLTPAELESQWREWVARRGVGGLDCASLDCLRHRAGETTVAACTERSLPVLTVYSSPWCGPCREFQRDLQEDAQFRLAIRERFCLHIVDIDRQPQLARSARIEAVPTFVTSRERFSGYPGKAGLLERLGIPTHGAAAVNETLPTVGPPAAVTQTALPEQDAEPGPDRRIGGTAVDVAARLAPYAFSALELLGIVGGSAATGGMGGLAIAAGVALLRRRFRRRTKPRADLEGDKTAVEGGTAAAGRYPFPRALDEAGELLRLRQSEGRVAVLDALRGMFLDDELERLAAAGDEATVALLKRLREAIDARVDEVAPLSTRLDE